MRDWQIHIARLGVGRRRARARAALAQACKAVRAAQLVVVAPRGAATGLRFEGQVRMLHLTANLTVKFGC